MLYIIVLSLLMLSSFVDGGTVRPTRLLPKNGTIMHCAGQVNQDYNDGSLVSFQNYSNYLKNGSRPTTLMMYFGITLPPANLTRYFSNLTASILSQFPDNQWLSLQFGLWYYDVNGNHFDCDIAAGKYDENIQIMINGFKEVGRPVFLRIGYEFNGNGANFDPTCYKNSYIYITKKLRADPWTNKWVANVWDYTADAQSGNLDWTVWYPGDDYVDWWGLNLFSQNAAPPPGSQFTTAFAKAAANASFPLMIGESTPRVHLSQCDPSPCTSWDDWYSQYFSFINNDTYTVRAFCYINWDWCSIPNMPQWGNAEINECPNVGPKFQDAIDTGNYFNQGTKQQVMDTFGLNNDSIIQNY